MSSVKDSLLEALKGLPGKVIEEVQQAFDEHDNELLKHQRSVSIIHATDAFLEAGIPEEQIIQLLQKHWKIQKEDAVIAIGQAHNRATKETQT